MQFNSVGASNGRNYAQAGKTGADAAVKAFAVARKSGPNYAELSKIAMATQSAEKQTAMNAEAQVAQAGIRAVGNAKVTQLKAQTAVDLTKMEAKQRKAGGIAALGKMVGAGYLAFSDPTKGREMPTNTAEKRALYEQYRNANNTLTEQRESARSSFTAPEFKPTATSGGGGESSAGKVTSGGSSMTGNAKTVADAIAKYESGEWGYEAFNQGGAAGGTKVVGKSGSHKDVFGRSLTDMTLGEIFHKQNTKQRGLSMQEHLNSGGLHAVGRYQFIGSTLQDEVSRLGISHDTKFTPEVQDQIFLSHVKRVGNISPWVGPMQHYSQSQKNEFNNMIKGL